MRYSSKVKELALDESTRTVYWYYSQDTGGTKAGWAAIFILLLRIEYTDLHGLN